MVWHGISRYVIWRAIPFFLVGFLFFELLLLTQHVFKLVAMHTEDAVPLLDVLQLLIFSIPFTAQVGIPLGCLIAIVVTLGTLSSDSEIIAMRAAGLSVPRILSPAFFVGFIFFIIEMVMIEYLLPWGNSRYVELYTHAIQVNPVVLLNSKPSYPGTDGNQDDFQIYRGGVDVEKGLLFDPKIRFKGSADQGILHVYADRGYFLSKDEDQKAYPVVLERVTTIPYHYKGHYKKEKGDKQPMTIKTSTREVFYIPDPKDENQSGGYAIKAQSMMGLHDRIRNRERDNLFRKFDSTTRSFYSKIKKRRLEYRIESLECNPSHREDDEIDAIYNDIPFIENGNEDVLKAKKVIEEKLKGSAQGIVSALSTPSSQASEHQEKPSLHQSSLLSRLRAEMAEHKIFLENESEKQRAELNNIGKDRIIPNLQFEFHLKLALPFACFAFILIGSSLGLFSGNRSGRSASLGMGALIGFLWMVLRTGLIELYRQGYAYPWMPAWLPNIIVVKVGIIVLIHRIRK